jgi:hypothetical protein
MRIGTPVTLNREHPSATPVEIDPLIRLVRGQRMILDRDLARVYGVETRALNQAVRRNADRFPSEFLCELTREEILSISQTVISLGTLRFSRQVSAFTEHGALMAATVLNSPRAVRMSLFIIRAFVKSREQQSANLAILKRLTEIDRALLAHDAALRDLYRKLRPLLLPPPEPAKKEIGFHTLK